MNNHFRILIGELNIENDMFPVKNIQTSRVRMSKSSNPSYQYQLIGFSSKIKQLKKRKGEEIKKFTIIDKDTNTIYTFSQGILEYASISDERFSLHAKRLYYPQTRKQS